MSEFSGKTALVTGAASGIGAACARWLAAQGICRLVLVDRDGEALDRLEFSGERIVGDVADEALWERLEGDIRTLDYAVLNAGIAAGGTIADTSFAEWRKVMGVNLDGMFLSLRTAMRRMSGGGAVVLTSSVAGFKTEPGNGLYGVTKAGVIHLAKAAAKERAGKGLRVNAIAPGGVDTAIWDGIEFFKGLVAQTGSREAAIAAMGSASAPLGRFATAEEIAGQVGFLLSDAAATITGTVLVSDGGYLL